MKMTACVLAMAMGLSAHRSLGTKMLVSVQKALDKKIISARAQAGGGLAVSFTVSNLAKDSVSLMLPAGWRFAASACKEGQGILLVHDQLLVLRPKESKTFELAGYCCEAGQVLPARGAAYTNGQMADSSLVRLALFLNAHPADGNTEQYAVWAISCRRPTGQITGDHDSVASLIRSYVAGMKHEPLPWFTLLKKAVVGGDGVVREYPVRLNALLSYAPGTSGYSCFYLLDANGIKAGKVTGQWLVLGGKNEYPVSLDLRGFKKGRYKLVLETAGSSIVEKEFTI